MQEAKRPSGRPRTFDRDAALEAAMLLFWRHGYEGVSIAELTAALGIKPPSLYAAFGSKEALYRACLRRYVEGEGGLGVAGLATVERIEEGARAVLEEAARAFTRPGYPPGCFVSVGALRCAAENRIIAEETAAVRKASLEVVLARLERARASGEIPPDTDVAALAGFYAAVVEGMAVQAADGASRERLIAIAAVAMRAWPRG